MPWTIDAAGKPEWVDAGPDRMPDAPAPAAPGPTDGSTLRPELENRLDEGPTVQLVDEAGRLFDAPAAQAEHHVAGGGYRLASPEEVQRWDTRQEREGAIETLTAFGESAISGAADALLAPANLIDAATGGRGDASGRKFIEAVVTLGGGSASEYAERARLRAEEHGVASGAGSLVGTVVGGLGAGRALGAAAKGLGAGRIGQAAAIGAGEGAVQNVAMAREEAYIKNQDLTAEQMLAAMGWGALVGGGVGFAAGGAGRLFSRQASRGATPFDSPRLPGAAGDVAEGGGGKLVASELPEVTLPGVAPAAEKKSTSAFGDWLRTFSEERTTKALGARGSDIRKLGKTGEKAEAEMRRMARDVLEGHLDDGTKIFRPLQSQDELVQNLVKAREEAGAALGSFRDRVGSYIDDSAPELRPRPATVAERIEREVIAPLAASAVPQLAKRADEVRGVVDGLRALGDDVSLADLTRVRKDLADVIYPKPTGAGLPPLPPNAAAELQRAERIIEDEVTATIDKATAKMGGTASDQYGTLKAKFRSFREAAQIAGKADLQDLGNRVASPTDYLAGATVFAADAASGGMFSAVKAGAAAALHKGIREHSSAVLAVLADRLAQTVERKSARAIDGFFEKTLTRTMKPGNDVTASRIPRPSSKAVTAAVTPLALFMGKDDDRQEAYRKRVREVLEANRDFGAQVRHRTQTALGDLPVQAPKLAAAIATKATVAAQFLASKIPAPIVNSQSFTPHAAVLPVSDIELEQFARTWAAVASPMTVLEDFRDGRATPEQVEALKVVYPELYQGIRTKVLERLVELDRQGAIVPYEARLELDRLLSLDGAGEPTASPAFLQRFQQIQAASPNKGNPAQPQPPARPINIADRLRSGRDALDPSGAQ